MNTDPQAQPKLKRLYFKTYLSLIENAPGTNMFRHFYVRTPEGNEFDAIGDGENACAFFVSSVLTLVNRIEGVHGTVTSTLKDLEQSGWIRVSKPQPGDVISWEPRQHVDGVHGHIGFYVGDGQAVSTSTSQKAVAKHDLHYGTEQRQVIGVYRLSNWEDQ